MKAQPQALPQHDANELVRIIITCSPGASELALAKAAMAEGMPCDQAIETVRSYVSPWRPRRARRCVEHNSLGCERCFL